MTFLPRDAKYYFAKPSINRGRDPKDYENLLVDAKIFYKIFNSVQEAYISAKQDSTDEDLIFIGGSNFVVGDFLEKKFA